MRKFNILAFLALVVSLFIYLFFRTQYTVINQITINLIPFEIYAGIRTFMRDAIPLYPVIIYSLPEGLWIFATCLLAQKMYLQVFKYRIKLIFLSLIFAIPLELLQLFKLNNGKFDYADILLSILFWLLGFLMVRKSSLKQNLFKSFTLQKAFFILAYLSVFLAHVWK